MKLRLGLCLGGLLAAGFGIPARAESPPAQPDPSVMLVRSVAATEIQRTAALVSGDTRVLEQIFAEELTYGHADGRVDTKDALLTSLTIHRLRYHAINPGPRTVRVVGDNVALVAGTADLLVGTADAPTAFSIRYLAVYRFDPRAEGWKLTAYQSTPLAPPAE
jgi:hypothetical protein